MRKPGLPKLTKQSMEDAPEDTKYIESIKQTVNVAVQEIEQLRSASHGIDLLSNANVEQVEVDVQMPDPWIVVGYTPGAPSFQNGWMQNDDCVFSKSPDGVVEVIVSLSGSGAAFFPAFKLPVGYTPKHAFYFFSWGNGTATAGAFLMSTDGSISPQFIDDMSGHVRFLAADSTPIPASCWPKMVKTKFKKVSAVIVADVFDAETTKPLPCGSVWHPIWETASENGIPQIKLLNIAGLPYNRKSRVRLLIIGG